MSAKNVHDLSNVGGGITGRTKILKCLLGVLAAIARWRLRTVASLDIALALELLPLRRHIAGAEIRVRWPRIWGLW